MTCNLLAVAAVTLIISLEVSIKSLVNNSTVPLELIALSLYTLNTSLPFVIVTVIASALPLSSDTNIDCITDTVSAGQVQTVVALVVVKSVFTFLSREVLRTFATIYLFVPFPHRRTFLFYDSLSSHLCSWLVQQQGLSFGSSHSSQEKK